MSDPYTHQGVNRMFPGSLGGRARVASSVSPVPRQKFTYPVAVPPAVVHWSDESGDGLDLDHPKTGTLGNVGDLEVACVMANGSGRTFTWDQTDWTILGHFQETGGHGLTIEVATRIRLSGDSGLPGVRTSGFVQASTVVFTVPGLSYVASSIAATTDPAGVPDAPTQSPASGQYAITFVGARWPPLDSFFGDPPRDAGDDAFVDLTGATDGFGLYSAESHIEGQQKILETAYNRSGPYATTVTGTPSEITGFAVSLLLG